MIDKVNSKYFKDEYRKNVLSTRSSLHSYLLSCDPPSQELVAGVALVARLTALLDQFPHQVWLGDSTKLSEYFATILIHDFCGYFATSLTTTFVNYLQPINPQVPPPALLESVHYLSSILSSLDSKAALAVAKLIETWSRNISLAKSKRNLLANTKVFPCLFCLT